MMIVPKYLRRWMCVMALALSAVSAFAQSPLDIPGAERTRIGIYIEDLRNGDVLLDVNGEEYFTPASVTKSVTAATAMSIGSMPERFATDVVATGNITSGVLSGDLVIRTVGDPTIESEYFPETSGFADSIAAAVRRAGISRIEGSVVIDQSYLPASGIPSGWEDEDLVWPYGTEHHTANFRDNKFVLTMPSKKSQPHVPDLVVRHSPGNGALKVDRDRGSDVIKTRGTVRKRGQSITVSTPDPSKVMRHELVGALADAGVEVGDRSKGLDASDGKIIYTHYSPLVTDILQSLMFRSDNMMAEAILRSSAPGKSRSEATDEELNLWKMRDVDTEGIVIEDGSGLSRKDRLTPYFLADIYVWMSERPSAAAYASLFPRAGLDGTMKGFLKDTPLEGTIAMKTGSMKGVQSYAGYKLDPEGFPTHVIVVMVNGFTCSRARLKSAIERMLLEVFIGPEPEPTLP